MKILKEKQEVRGKIYRVFIICFLLLISCFFSNAFAEDDVMELSKDKLINIDLLGVAFGMARVEYEQSITENSSLVFRGIFWHSTTESWRWDTYGGGFNYKRYGNKFAEGEWLAGGFDILDVYARYMGKDERGYFVFPYAEAGYSFLLKETDWVITPSVSLGNYIGNIEISNSNIPISGAGMRLSVLLSYPF
ncbi:MAG: hypothetical protein AABZ28_06350 [Nitrospinota bacterium]|jgi:hypothetical protein